jgi:predicted nucleic acid-binding protein
MKLAVVDASVLVAFYATNDHRRSATVTRLTVEDSLFAPAHLDVEVISALRGMARASPEVGRTVPWALRHLAGFPIRRVPVPPLLVRMWDLRNNMTPYDAAYVALAERLDGTLITCDAKMAAASGVTCTFDVIS